LVSLLEAKTGALERPSVAMRFLVMRSEYGVLD
jgi:hypothetical protein